MSTTPKPATPPPVRVSAATMQFARRESAVNGRSVSGQVDYWARLGRAVEASPAFDRERVKRALAGLASVESLTAEERAVYDANEFEAMEQIETPSGKAFWAQLKAKGGGVGVDDAGRLVKGNPDGTVTVLRESAD